MPRIRITTLFAAITVASVLAGCIEQPAVSSRRTPLQEEDITSEACSETAAAALVSSSVVRVQSQVPLGPSVGTGVIVEPDVVLTAAHILGVHLPDGTFGRPQLGEVEVQRSDGAVLRGRAIAIDEEADLAIVTVPTANLPTSSWGNSSTLQIGDRLLATGYALDLPGQPTTTSGILSATRFARGLTYLQTDTPLNPGNSGGPLYDLCGRVVGIVTARVESNIGVAIASSNAQRITEHLVTTGHVPQDAPPVLPTGTPTQQRPSDAPILKLAMPKFGVEATVSVGRVGADGVMRSPPGPWDVLWYDFTARPGFGSNAVFSGYADYIGVGPAAFWHLKDLVYGDEIQVQLEDGTVYRYAVASIEMTAAAMADIASIVGPTPKEVVTLLTASGEFDPQTSQYDQRLIIRAERLTD